MKKIKLSRVIGLFLIIILLPTHTNACCWPSKRIQDQIADGEEEFRVTSPLDAARTPRLRTIHVAPAKDPSIKGKLSTRIEKDEEDPIAVSSLSEAIPLPPAPKVHPKALIVDDQSVKVLKSFLSSLGFDVTVLTSGQEAIDSFNSGNIFDLVVMDYNMPGKTGLETMRSIRVNHPDLDIPCVLHSSEDEITKAKAMATEFMNSKREVHRLFDGELPKPCTKQQLIALLGTLPLKKS